MSPACWGAAQTYNIHMEHGVVVFTSRIHTRAASWGWSDNVWAMIARWQSRSWA